MVEIIWKPTAIGGEELRYDFCATAEGVLIGRIVKIDHGPSKGEWTWSCMLGHSEFAKGNSSKAASKQQAADEVRAWFGRYLVTPEDRGGGLGLEPEEWPPDQASIEMKRLRKANQERFRQHIENIRAGKVPRNPYYWRRGIETDV